MLIRKLIRNPQTENPVNLAVRRIWLADPPPADPPAPAPATDKPTPADELKFSQKDFDFHMGKRAKEAEATTRLKLLKELGFENPDDQTIELIKSRMTAAQAAEDSKKSELEKAKEAIAAAQKEAADAKAAAAKIEAERRTERRNAAIVEALKNARATEPDDLFILMNAKKPDMVTAVMNDEGTLDEKALKALVDATREAYKARFTGTGPGSPSNNNGRNPKTEPDFGTKPLVKF